MKKILFLVLTIILGISFVYAQDDYLQKWKNDNISIEAARHMLQVDDGLIVGGYDHDFVVQLAKYDDTGKEVKTLKLDYEGTVCGFYEKDGKYYFITTNDDNWWEVMVYEITSDLTIVRKKATSYHMEEGNEQTELVGDKLYITTTGFGKVGGIFDDDDNYYDYFSINLVDFSVEAGNKEEWNFGVFGTEIQNNIKLNDAGIPGIVIKEKGDLTVVGGKMSPYDDSEGFIRFFNNTSNIVEDYDNNKFINEKLLTAGHWYTRIALLEDYIIAGGENYQAIDFFTYDGKYVDSINLVEELYESSVDKTYIQIEDIIYMNGRISVAYQVCDIVNDCPIGCKSGIAVFHKKYNIETKTDGNGIVKSETNSEYGSEEVSFNIEPNEGYVIKAVKVTDKDGNVITYTKDDVKGNKFKMPYADVTIEVEFEPKNPETLAGVAIFGSFIILIVSFMVAVINIKKARELL